MNFRCLLETRQLVAQLLPQVNAHRASKGSHLRGLTIVDASLIAAPSSTTNRRGQRDAQLHQTTTGNQWSVGMTAHRGADDASGLVSPHVHCTAADVADVTQDDRLLDGEDNTVCGDSGDTGADNREELQQIAAVFLIAARPSQVRAIQNRKERGVVAGGGCSEFCVSG